MKLPSLIHLVVSAASAHAALLKAYEQFGGDAFPNYQCLPSFGSVVPHLFPYAQCGGQEFRGSTICAYGWDCVIINQFFSQCQMNTNYVPPALSPTPNLAGPGNFCAGSAIARGQPAFGACCYAEDEHYFYEVDFKIDFEVIDIAAY
ncbi:uncharacterized protein RCO7_02617 [Rhynchosporium graminicola]|uniref:CBM1 domain-containing protein n=1 Tax=Rhynchosporium graminicola TaxID=2792576 RepID=A0A1E1KFQ5_9HELO|nr:uncharacterized protein RCO7_02617 [Rhynchosporium commune]